jgi:transcriptional regulator with GAF, ATPase, and Fis domain
MTTSPASGNNFLQFPFSVIESFLHAAHFGLAIVDADLRYLYINERLVKIHGLPVDQHIGRSVSDVHSGISAEEETGYRQVLDTGMSVFGIEGETPALNSPDMNYWGMNFYPIKSSDGQLQQIVMSIRNITKRKLKGLEVEERLRFEVMLSQLSSTFVNLPTNEIDAKICDGLKSIVEFLGFDRSAISEFTSDQENLIRTHHYCLPGVAVPPDVSFSEQLPRWVKSIRRGAFTFFSSLEELPQESWRERKFCEEFGYKSMISIPLRVGGTILGAVVFTSSRSERKWPEDIIRRLQLVGEVFASALERKRTEQKLEQAFLEISKLKDRLEAENLYLRDEIQVIHRHEEIIGQSATIRKTLSQLEQVAGTDSTVLILGETGTGKELMARAIHNLSSRKGKTMVKVNCAALPATLIESELFGREKGAYTGALTKQIGRFEAANGSTIFLDEIGELPLELQSKLLRVLQEGQFERLGSNQTINTNVRVVAATNRELAQAVKEGKFREDLYYRLNVFPISVPPLRERREDIPVLIWAFVREFSRTMGKTIESISKTSLDACLSYSWPGNVRELRNIVERALILSNSPTLRIELPRLPGSPPSHATTLHDVERQHIMKVMENTGWRVRGRGGAAEVLGLIPTTLDSKLQKLGIKRNSHEGGQE